MSAGKKKRPSVPQRAPAPARVRRRAAPPRIAKPVKAVKRAEPVSAPRAKTLRAASANGGWTRDEAPTRGDAPLRLLAPDGAWLGEGSGPDLPDATLLALFKGMLEVRLLDGRMLNLQRQGRIGFYGQSTGQEAAIIGSAAAATAQDWVAPALREAGVAVWRGLPLARLIAQCMARDGEPSRGRQMPCHHTFRAGNFISMSSVIATQIVHATGIALAAKLKRDPVVAIGYLGDGATSEHDFHCALNFAAVWKAPSRNGRRPAAPVKVPSGNTSTDCPSRIALAILSMGTTSGPAWAESRTGRSAPSREGRTRKACSARSYRM